MENGYPHSDWYDQTTAVVPAAKPEARRKSRTGFKAAMLVVSLLILITASVFAFSHSAPVMRTERDGFSGSESPAEEQPQTDPGASSGTTSGSLMQRVEADRDVTLELVPTDGLEELSLQTLYSVYIDSVVGIKAYYEGVYGYGWGSGIVMTEDGYILTNQHIIDAANRASVVLPDGTELDALLIGEDTQTDIAVLKVEATGLTPAVFGDSDALSVGDAVAAIGNPLGSNLSGTLTDGIISAINRDIQVSGRRMTLLQTDAALNEGSSGGPLINMYGQVVGITSLRMVSRSSEVNVEGIGFAIPSTTVKTIADQLIAAGEVTGRPGIGITVATIPTWAAAEYSYPDGLYVYAVSTGSDAEAKGVQPGDILTHVNGQAVAKTDDVLSQRDLLNVGDTLTLTLYRDGEIFDVDITLQDIDDLY